MICHSCGKKVGVTYRDKENHRDLCENCFFQKEGVKQAKKSKTRNTPHKVLLEGLNRQNTRRKGTIKANRATKNG